jgi:hypothetical protein
LVLVSILLHASASVALLSDKKQGKWNLIGKFKTEATFRTTDTPDNNPIPIEKWDLVSQRNVLFLELQHDLGDVLPWLEVGYFLQGRLFYDSAWDVGPDVLKDDDTRNCYTFDNRDEIDDEKWDADLFQGYLDLTAGPVFERVGRQVLSWGEMSTLRVLDGINPMDNSSLSVDLLERRIPLFMTRTTLTFDEVGPFSEVSLEGYYVPGAVDNTNGEDIINGSPIIPPVGRCTQDDLEDCSDPMAICKLQQVITQEEDDFDEDRYGVKLGMLLGGLELNFAYFRSYSSIPVPFLEMDAFKGGDLTPDHIRAIVDDGFCDPIGTLLGPDGLNQKLNVLLAIDKVDVYGGSFNYYWRLIDTVVRGEVALYKNVPMMTSGSVPDMIAGMGSKVYLPPPFDSITLKDVFESPLLDPIMGDLESQVLPFSSGTIQTHDIWKYGLGFDRSMHVPYLNRDEFFLILEYVGNKIMDYEEKTLVKPWKEPNGDPVYENEWSNTIVFIATTNYLNGNLVPRLVTMYEFEPRAISFIPSVKYEWRAMEFELSYFHTESDTYEGNLGMLESRNEVSFRYTLNF